MLLADGKPVRIGARAVDLLLALAAHQDRVWLGEHNPRMPIPAQPLYGGRLARRTRTNLRMPGTTHARQRLRAVGTSLLLAVAAAAPVDASQDVTTVELTLAGRPVVIDVYRPPAAAGPSRGAVVLSHGFTRSRTTMGGHAAVLASEGVLALTPDLPFTFDFERNARGLAELVARLRSGSAETGPPVARVVLVGFSAGGLSSLLAADTPGVVGYVGLDPFDREVTHESDGRRAALGRDFAPTLRTEALLLRAPPSRCNAQAVAAPWAGLLQALVADRVIDGASHCDFEAPSDWMCHWACGAPDPARQAQVRRALLDAIDRWLPRGVATATR